MEPISRRFFPVFGSVYEEVVSPAGVIRVMKRSLLLVSRKNKPTYPSSVAAKIALFALFLPTTLKERAAISSGMVGVEVAATRQVAKNNTSSPRHEYFSKRLSRSRR